MHISVAPSPHLNDTAKHVEVRLENEQLLIPERLYALLTPQMREEALTLFSYLQAFPSTFISLFGWTDAEVINLKEKVQALLKPIYPDIDAPPKKRSFGVNRDQPLLSKKTPRS